MWTLIFVIILSFLFLLTGVIIVLAISFGNYFISKRSKAGGGEKENTSSATKP